ncbi:MAG: molecular chaperone TorD family protein [Phycisphaeraceae bacterium]|nr:molecular chaperone TorD family protein [Phycisphaeraceae bacterium]
MDKQHFSNFECARAGIFNGFTALLCQPEEGLIEDTDIFDTLKLAFDVACPDCSALVLQMQEAVKENTTQELLVEYAKLFIGPFKTLAPPYSSLYFGSDMLMNDETIWVMNCYKKAGLEFDKKLNDVPDHVAVETEFMYYLIHSELKELDAGNRDNAHAFWEHQQTFFTRHYKKWVPQFCEKILSATENEYYKKLSESLNSFVNQVEIPAFTSE